MSLRFGWLICGLLALAGLVMGYRAVTAPGKAVVTIQWVTASELNTAGFNLYRSDHPEGPFTRINDHLIPGSPDPLVGGSYVFTDTTAVSGRTYYYQLEDVENSGATTRHGVVKVKAQGIRGAEMLLAIVLMSAAVLGWGMMGLSSSRRRLARSCR